MKQIKRIVVKVGSSTLTHPNGALNLRAIEKLTRVLCDIRSAGCEVALVSSGAGAAGRERLRMTERPAELPLKQAAASVGQVALMYLYEKLFSEYGHIVGQILLDREDIERESRRRHLLNTFDALFSCGVVPVINENDSVAVEELKLTIGENDTLSAMVAALIGADLLVLLTDIDGLYDADPRSHPDARRIDRVDDIAAAEQVAGGAGTDRGTGGMATKVKAAKIATAAGIDTVVAAGGTPELIYDLLEGRPAGTLFAASKGRDGETP